MAGVLCCGLGNAPGPSASRNFVDAHGGCTDGGGMGAPTGLIFNNLSWPHVSVATLVPADPINIPDFAIRLPHAPSFFGARVRASARVQPVVLAVEDLGEAARNLEQSIPR